VPENLSVNLENKAGMLVLAHATQYGSGRKRTARKAGDVGQKYSLSNRALLLSYSTHRQEGTNEWINYE
jgi:hypothetical protein